MTVRSVCGDWTLKRGLSTELLKTMNGLNNMSVYYVGLLRLDHTEQAKKNIEIIDSSSGWRDTHEVVRLYSLR